MTRRRSRGALFLVVAVFASRWTCGGALSKGASGRATKQPPGSKVPGRSDHAQIQFFDGIEESVVPRVSLTRSTSFRRDGDENFFTGTATFAFERADALEREITSDSLITAMRLIDTEGHIETDDARAEFERGNPKRIVAVLILASPAEWNRFMRFMRRYAIEHDLEFTPS